METELAAARARRGSRAQGRRSAKGRPRRRRPKRKRKIAMAPFKDPARLAPASAFADTKGPAADAGRRRAAARLRRAGRLWRRGERHARCNAARAPVVSPCDGWAAFAGPYRTYGQLLIINAGGGYYIVLAGMDRINVNVGQFVLAGEPVALMGERSARTAAAIAIGATRPILYIEFRKDGAAIDPGPWWARPELQKVRG